MKTFFQIVIIILKYRNAIVFEDVGESILPVSQLIANEPLDLPSFLSIAVPVSEALHYLHSHNIIHGDGM